MRHPRYLWIAHLIILFTIALSACLAPASTYAVPKDDGPDGPSPRCTVLGSASARLVLEGIFLNTTIVRGRVIIISAETAKIIIVSQNCDQTLYPLPNGKFAWSLTRPTFSGATLQNSSTLRPSLTPDRNGSYRVTFTACQGGCSVQSLDIPQFTTDLLLTVVEQLALPLGTDPVVPTQIATQPSSIPDADTKCRGGGGVVDPQWVTVNPWTGPADYRLVEGEVEKARISRKDNFLNHDSQDFNLDVKPDPAFRNLLRGTQDGLEVEWERNHFPEPFRPTPGDRVAAFGYWILDCGHDGKTEIHAPVGIAVQRARSVAIPDDREFLLPGNDDVRPVISATVGTGVIVPGIVTELFFNRDSGEITRNCSSTGLHQPARLIPGTPTPLKGACIRGPAPINERYSFNIYLPPKPQLTNSFPVPLYFAVEAHPAGFNTGPTPQIQLINANGAVPYLNVTVDLRTFTGSRYARRISAGWVLPSPDNWGVRRWKLRLNKVQVHDDGDGITRGDGDWRFWLDTNNSNPEWTKIFDCDGCVHGEETFGGRPYQTGTSAEVTPDRSLGPDHLLFPNQRLWVHSSGYEDDPIVSDDTGSVNFLALQRSDTYAIRGTCKEQTSSGCADYTLHFMILPGTQVPPATLTSASQRLLDRYTIGPNTDAICVGCLDVAKEWYPFDAKLTPRSRPIVIAETPLFRMQTSLETHALTDITLDDLRSKLNDARIKEPEDLAVTMREMRAEVQAMLASPLRDEARQDVLSMSKGIPEDLWLEYFGDLPFYKISMPLVTR